MDTNDLIMRELTEIRARLDAVIERFSALQPRPLPGWRAGGNPTGTSLMAEFPTSYARLAALLGEPSESDGYKVSTEWTFTCDADGQCVTLYDYKETNMYDSDLPSVADFRAQPSYNWHIGASSRAVAQRFADALRTALG